MPLTALADHEHIGLSSLPPLSLYIHIPWCIRKCPYCDFNSHEARKSIPEAAYIDALIADLETALPNIWGRRMQTIFFGGGTPSLFSAASLDRLLSAIRARINLAPDAEITLEANPGTFEAEKFAAYRKLGVNRLSIGIQSFNPQYLKALGRIHDDDEARRAVAIAKDNFDNFNLDLMYALPEQGLQQALADIDQAVSLGAPHISAYHLTLEPNTLFHKHPPPLPDHDASAAMQEAIEARLADAGYRHYETSAFAKPGHSCRHNLNYWQFGDYLGIGAGAHSKLSYRDRIVREMRYKHPETYLQKIIDGNAVQEHRTISAADLPFEFMMNALRLTDGVPLELFSERTGLPINIVSKVLAEAQAKQLVAGDHQHLAPTEKGQRFLNDLLEMFLPEK
ncbi:MAG: radical SAM family heme chaperone HemW [Burkholderiales bacterium]